MHFVTTNLRKPKHSPINLFKSYRKFLLRLTQSQLNKAKARIKAHAEQDTAAKGSTTSKVIKNNYKEEVIHHLRAKR